MARRGRPPHPEPITPAESRVLELVREGKNNAEIAVRLGISVNTVRFHVSHLLSKAGATSRHDLADWRPRHSMVDRLHSVVRWPLSFSPLKLAIGGGTLAAVIGAAGLAQLAGGGDSSAPEPMLPEGYRTLEAADLLREDFIDMGPLIESVDGRSAPVAGGQLRAVMSVIVLNGPAKVVAGVPGDPWLAQPQPGANSVSLSRPVSGTLGPRWYVSLWAEDRWASETATIRLGPNSRPEIQAVGQASHPQLLLNFRGEPDGRRYTAALDSRGHLFIHRDPVPENAVIEEWTGERLDVSRAEVVGSLLSTSDIMFTACENQACRISYRVRVPLVAPFDGWLTCPPETTATLATDEFRIEFTSVDSGAIEPAPVSCEGNRTVEAGDVIASTHHYALHAYRSDGSAVSIAVALDGTLYIGDIHRGVGCPCETGN